MEKNMLNEVNTIREQMGLRPLNEVELLELQISKLDLENLDEGMWEKIKGGLAKLGSYKKGGVALAKFKTNRRDDITGNTIGAKFDRSGWNPANWELQTRWGVTKAAEAKIKAILEKENNQIIRDLDAQIKKMAPDFPNTTDQLKFVETVAAIGGVYDTIVAHSKLKPTDKNYLTDVQANSLIDDLREYLNKYLDYDLSAVFSAFNEGEEIGEEGQVDINEIEGNLEEDKARDAEIERQKTQLAAKAADTKAAIKKGELKAYDSTRMKTLKSWTLPTLMGLSGIGWLVKGLLTPDEVKTMTKEEVEKIVEKRLDPSLLHTQKYGEGMTQCINAALRQLGSKIVITPNSSPAELKAAFAAIGGGDYKVGIDAVCSNAPDHLMSNPAEAKEIVTAVVEKADYKDKKLVEIFKGVWAGTGKVAGDLLTTVRGGQIVGMIVNAATIWKTKTITTTVVAAGAGKKGLIFMGGAAIAGAVALALLRYKGTKSSRAQILNDLMQRLRPVAMSNENPIDPNPNPDPVDPKKPKQGQDLILYNKLKDYFKDLYNFRSQVNTDTYGKGGTSNAEKVYSGGGEVPSNLQVTPKDADDLLKLMENLQTVSEETLEDIGLSSNQLKLLKTNIIKLKQLIEMIKGFNSQDPKLNGMIQNANQNPVVKTDIDSLLQSDAKSLKIFVSDFNKALYATKLQKGRGDGASRDGNSLIDQLGKIQINKLKEKAERLPSKGSMNAIYNNRRAFLANLPGYMNSLFSIFSYLIDQMTKNPEGNKPEQADYLTGQKGGKQSPGLTSTGKAQMNKGLNAANSGDTFGGFRAAGQNLEEGSVLTKAEMIAIMIEEAMVAPEEGGEQNPEEVVNQNGRHFKIMKALALVAPTYSTRIAKGYNDMYPEDPKISPTKLRNYLTVTLNALAFVPEGRMKRFIKMGGGDLSSYIAALNRIDEAGSNVDALKESANYKLMMALSTVITDFQSKIAMTYNQQNPMDRLSAPKLAAFLQSVLVGAAMMSRDRMRMFIINSDGDFSAYTKALANISKLEPGEEPAGGNFPVDTFKPDNVSGYDLRGQKDSFRIGLSKKAAEVISRQTDTKLDEKNMLVVMKMLIDTLNKKYLRPEKQIPMTGQQPA